MIGGIDLGGTKIEARLFDQSLAEIARHRIPTPTASYMQMRAGIAAQVAWLEAQGKIGAIGLGTPGVIDPTTGIIQTANLPASGQSLAADLSNDAGRVLHVINDCAAFALAEALMGAGQSCSRVFGLVIGTGVSGAQVHDGEVFVDPRSQEHEFGHLAIPMDFVVAHDLPILRCGCGRHGCYETYLSGPGLIRLAHQMTGEVATTQHILGKMPAVRGVWTALAARLITQIIADARPDVIILGGGLGTVANLPEQLAVAMNTSTPAIVVAQHGDASGALGAALYARQQTEAST